MKKISIGIICLAIYGLSFYGSYEYFKTAYSPTGRWHHLKYDAFSWFITVVPIFNTMQCIIGYLGFPPSESVGGEDLTKYQHNPKFDCSFKVCNPYYLVRFHSGLYGIIKKDPSVWYMNRVRDGGDFDLTPDDQTLQVKDSCDAKEQLKLFLDERNKYQYQIK